MFRAIKDLFGRGKRSIAMAFALLFMPFVANAADSFDTTAIVNEISGAKAPILAVGAAIFGIVAIILAFRMIRKITG